MGQKAAPFCMAFPQLGQFMKSSCTVRSFGKQGCLEKSLQEEDGHFRKRRCVSVGVENEHKIPSTIIPFFPRAVNEGKPSGKPMKNPSGFAGGGKDCACKMVVTSGRCGLPLHRLLPSTGKPEPHRPDSACCRGFRPRGFPVHPQRERHLGSARLQRG